MLVVHPGIAVGNLQELVALARSKPGSLSFASPGAGSQAHVADEFLKGLTGIDMIHIAYKGTGPALNDLLGGQISMMFSQLSSALPHIKAGKLRALGVASLKRSVLLPALPTVAEQNLPGFEAVSWYALMAPAGTPVEVIAKLKAESARILRLPDLRDKRSALGAEAVGKHTAELAAIIRAGSVRWQKVVKDANIKAKYGRPRFSAGTRQHSAPLSKVATETCFGLQLLTLTIWRLAMTQLSTLEIPPELKAAIAEIAKRAQRPESDIAADALRAYLQRNAEYLRRVRSGIEQADCGEFVPDQDMEALFTRLAVDV